MNAFEELVRLLAPPSSPLGVCDEPVWAQASAELPVLPPPDYRRFLATYGTGFIGIKHEDPHWLVLRSPQRVNGYAELVEGFKTGTKQLREFKAISPKSYPYSILPEAGGLFPFAHDSCGFEYYWLTSGNPDDWQVLVDPDLCELVNLKLSFSEFVLTLVKGQPAYRSFSEIDPRTVIWTPEKPENLLRP